MAEDSASKQIDTIIQAHGGWKGEILSHIRQVITQADPEIIEEIKWRMASRPEGLPVWSYNGIVCFTETWKDNIKLLFQKGAKITDHKKLFSARLESSSIRAIEFREGDAVDKAALEALVLEAIQLNKN